MNPRKQTLPDFCTFLNEKKHRSACKALFCFQSKLSEGKRNRRKQKHMHAHSHWHTQIYTQACAFVYLCVHRNNPFQSQGPPFIFQIYLFI